MDHLRNIAASAYRAALNLLYPPECLFCSLELGDEAQETPLCEACQQSLISTAPACLRCAAPLPSEVSSPDCPRCRRENLRYNSVTALGCYENELRQAVLRIKQAVGEPLALGLADRLAERVAGRFAPNLHDIVVVTPVHWRDRIARGHYGPNVLAERVAGRLGLEPGLDALYFRRKVLKQSSLPRTQRFANVRGALGVSDDYDLNDSRILLVDDILTTGATCGEATRALKQAGAAQIDVAVVAVRLDIW